MVYSQVIDFARRIITDPKLIDKYNAEFKYRFYQPSYEDNWLDPDIVNQSVYHDSRESINYVFNPIYVSVNDKDEKIDDPTERVHGRILDGRQRYADSKKNRKPWPVVYVYIKDYEEFLLVMATMGSKKNPRIQSLQTQSIVRSCCDVVWRNKPREIYDDEGFPDKERVCAYVKKILSKRWHESTIEKAVPQEYKNKVKVQAGKHTPKPVRTVSKLRQENINLKDEKDRLMKYIDVLEKRVMPEDKKDQTIAHQDNMIKGLKVMIGLLKSDIREARKKAGLDESTKDFERYWESATQENRMYQE